MQSIRGYFSSAVQENGLAHASPKQEEISVESKDTRSSKSVLPTVLKVTAAVAGLAIVGFVAYRYYSSTTPQEQPPEYDPPAPPQDSGAQLLDAESSCPLGDFDNSTLVTDLPPPANDPQSVITNDERFTEVQQAPDIDDGPVAEDTQRITFADLSDEELEQLYDTVDAACSDAAKAYCKIKTDSPNAEKDNLLCMRDFSVRTSEVRLYDDDPVETFYCPVTLIGNEELVNAKWDGVKPCPSDSVCAINLLPGIDSRWNPQGFSPDQEVLATALPEGLSPRAVQVIQQSNEAIRGLLDPAVLLSPNHKLMAGPNNTWVAFIAEIDREPIQPAS